LKSQEGSPDRSPPDKGGLSGPQKSPPDKGGLGGWLGKFEGLGGSPRYQPPPDKPNSGDLKGLGDLGTPPTNPTLKLANPRGFCAGVERAIEILNQTLEIFGPPIYVRHELVHNRFVVRSLQDRGAIFVDEIDQVPNGAILIFSAHGISQKVRRQATQRDLRVFDATCPLVTKVHLEVARHSAAGTDCILIGHAGHPEVEGTMGQYDPTQNPKKTGTIHLVENRAQAAALKVRDPKNLAYVTQTTLSVDDTAAILATLRARFPAIRGPRRADICYATQNRQDAVVQLALESDLVLVVGSTTSSNSNRLRELAARCGTESHLIDNAQQIAPQWLAGKTAIGITAGASAPEVLVQEVVAHLQTLGATPPTQLPGRPEKVHFPLPKPLRQLQKKPPDKEGLPRSKPP